MRVVDEMENAVNKYQIKEVWFDDDDFCINKKHVLDICTEIKRRQLNIKWSVMGDAMAIDEEMMKEMASAGCYFIKFGVESGSKQILKNIEKPLSPEKATEVAQWGRKYNVFTHATFTFGLSGETHDTMRETLSLAKKIKFDTAQMSIATPFPGTRFYDKLMQAGHLKQVDWDQFDGTNTCTVERPKLPAMEVEKFRKKAIRSIVIKKAQDPIWWLRYLRRNYILYKNYGLSKVLEPISAFFRL